MERARRVSLGGGHLFDLEGEALRDGAGRVVPLRPQASAVLRHLAASPGRLVTKDELMTAVWPNIAVTDDSLVQAIGDIRRAIGDEPRRVIRTVPRRGYRLVVPAGPSQGSGSWWSRRWRVAAVSTLLMAATLFLLAARDSRRPGPAPGAAATNGPPIVAFVPFVDLAADRASQSLLEGLRVESECMPFFFRDFVMVRRGPSFIYRDYPAASLAIDYVFSGVVQRDGDRLRILVELADVPTGKILWSERWDRPDNDIPAIQAEVSARVASRLVGADGLIQRLGRAAAEHKRPGERTAWDQFLLGGGQLASGTRAGTAEAAALLSSAVELDPSLSHASALLALASLRLAEFDVDPEANLQSAFEAAKQAVFLDGMDAWAHAALATAFRLSGDFVRARSEFETALALAPNTAEVMALFAGWAASGDEPERGAAIADRLVLLDPIVPPTVAAQLARAYFMAGRYRSALGMIERLPDDALTPALRVIDASALAAVGRSDEAAAATAAARAAAPGLSIAGMIGRPGWGKNEQRRLVETMRLAGFPPCAATETVEPLVADVRLPECTVPVRAAQR
jgi:TolB-like protein